MVGVADGSFLGGGSVEAAMMMAARDSAGLAPVSSVSTTGSQPSPEHPPTQFVAVAVAVNMAADLKYYELYRRSRYCMRAREA